MGMPKKYKDISRMDKKRNNTHGWYVRVRYYGKSFNKFFNDFSFGDKDLSLKAAIDWRNDLEKRLGKPRTDRQIVMVARSGKNIIPGVRLNEKLNRYDVSWCDTSGKQRKTSVSILKHGNKNALEKAIEIRAHNEAKRFGSEICLDEFLEKTKKDQLLKDVENTERKCNADKYGSYELWLSQVKSLTRECNLPLVRTIRVIKVFHFSKDLNIKEVNDFLFKQSSGTTDNKWNVEKYEQWIAGVKSLGKQYKVSYAKTFKVLKALHASQNLNPSNIEDFLSKH